MGLGVGVEGQPLAHERQTISEVEGAKARAGIVAAEFLLFAYVLKAQKALEEAMNGDGHVALPPQITVRSKPISTFTVGLNEIFSMCTQGSLGLV